MNFEELARSTDDFNGAQLKAVRSSMRSDLPRDVPRRAAPFLAPLWNILFYFKLRTWIIGVC